RDQTTEKYNIDPGYYQIHFDGLDPKAKLLELEINRGQGWVPAEAVDSITPTAFSQLYAPVAVNTVPEPITWSGEVTLEGHQILDQPLIIEPGTTVNLTPGATVVLKHRLTAIGTREAPIRFMPASDEQEPWGAIVLSGRGADGSTLSHCEMAGGSGLKGDLFEYSAMLSIHDVKDVVISDCQFRDNHVVDDMVHTVYTDIRFERVLFKNALSDALDLDISTASISDSRFESSGNDAVDLMTTQASITGSLFKNNGDKGISVGENSQLYAVNNTLQGNLIGVQSKDRSTAVLLNQTFTNNNTALHAYKKNWRYGEGGVIFLGKSTVSGGETSAAAEKRSVIQIFDSYLETPAKGKRVDTISVEHHASHSALERDTLPNPNQLDARLADPLRNIPAELLQQVTSTQRGSQIDS
ncbi:MAG: right-handed parallel beta-helix repeat-containing protein, partial [Gammaproteobacteria bacterium]|nr:right-handed parallel beta-helix repeat-containing protein [Gammaproteobacteria bacterium]